MQEDQLFVKHQDSLNPGERKSKNGVKTHHYPQAATDQGFALEPADQLDRYYMTAQGSDVQPGDYILITEQVNQKYQVERIDYYADSSDIWIALLKKS